MDKELLKRLKEEGEKKGLPPRFLEFYERLFCIQSGAEERIKGITPRLNRETIDGCLEQGSPLLNFGDLVLD